MFKIHFHKFVFNCYCLKNKFLLRLDKDFFLSFLFLFSWMKLESIKQSFHVSCHCWEDLRKEDTKIWYATNINSIVSWVDFFLRWVTVELDSRKCDQNLKNLLSFFENEEFLYVFEYFFNFWIFFFEFFKFFEYFLKFKEIFECFNFFRIFYFFLQFAGNV